MPARTVRSPAGGVRLCSGGTDFDPAKSDADFLVEFSPEANFVARSVG